MSNNGNLLKYLLYQVSGMARAWGSDRSNSLTGNGAETMQYFKIYGRIPENQNLPAGLYRDNILISLLIEESSSFAYQFSYQ